nr:transporter [Cupriavidus lacunae]
MGPWTVGLSGYYLKQVTDDKFNSAVVPELPGVWSRGRRGEVLAIGPSVSYTSARGTSFFPQWQHEAYAKDRFGGDKLWFKVVTAFSWNGPVLGVRRPQWDASCARIAVRAGPCGAATRHQEVKHGFH